MNITLKQTVIYLYFVLIQVQQQVKSKSVHLLPTFTVEVINKFYKLFIIEKLHSIIVMLHWKLILTFNSQSETAL